MQQLENLRARQGYQVQEKVRQFQLSATGIAPMHSPGQQVASGHHPARPGEQPDLQINRQRWDQQPETCHDFLLLHAPGKAPGQEQQNDPANLKQNLHQETI